MFWSHKRITMSNVLCLFLIGIFLQGIKSSSVKKALQIEVPNNSIKNRCSRIEKYSETKIVPYTYTYKEPYRVFCFRIPPYCTKYRTKSRQEQRTVSVFKTKTVFSCCKGYKDANGTCTAICHSECEHGACLKPDSCVCDVGWKGLNCSEECEDGWYGRNCECQCSCENGGKCNKENGTCQCPLGFTGIYCENICPTNSSCSNACNCSNGGVCGTDEMCDCLPGYSGEHCELTCEPGSYGKNCNETCQCDYKNTVLCRHINGECNCAAGWEGEICDQACNGSTWGPSCSNLCDCQSNGTCQPVTGTCSCPAGWHGSKCEDKCPEGYFEQDCKMQCPECVHQPGTCHHITGWCSCPPGLTGPFCDLLCPVQKYGENCSSDCLCENNSTCDSVTGECFCLPGWMEKDCSITCSEGFFGDNCSSICNCSDNSTCHAADGSCNCVLNTTDPLCPKVLSLGMLPELSPIEGASTFFMVLVAIAVIVGILLSAIALVYFFTKYKTKRHSNIYDDTSSTTNVIEEDLNNKPRYQFENPNYDTMDVPELPARRSIAVVPPVHPTGNFQNTPDKILDEEFKIPECEKETPKVEISFGIGDAMKVQSTPMKYSPKIRYSHKGISRECEDRHNIEENVIYADIE